MSEGNDEPIIINKGKKCEEGHHGGAWKVAYADFVTAMMALFIVLWILSSSEEIKEAVAGYFKDPFGYTTGGGRSVIEGFGSGMKAPSKTELSEEELRELEQEKLRKLGKQIYNQMTENAEFEGMLDQMSFEIVDEGLRIEIAEKDGIAFFNIGSADLKEEITRLLKQVGAELGKLNNKIAIEGHTDARPFPGSRTGYTNFELSSDRANAARRILEMSGVSASQISEIRGYAANRLRNRGNPLDVVNRRISIIVKYSENL